MTYASKITATAIGGLALLGASVAEAQTKIEFFFPVPVDGKLAREMTRLAKVFNEQQKEVDVTAVFTGSYDETKLKAQAAAKAGKPPAVVLMSANFVLDLKIAGEIASLEPMLREEGVSRDKFLADFWPALHANATVDGELYGVPYHNSTPLLYYNAEHFKEVGLDPKKPPQTWAELADYAKKLAKRNGDQLDRAGLLMPANYDYLGWLLESFALANGGQYFNPGWGGEVYYDSPSMLGAVKFWEDLVFKHKVMPPGVNDGSAVSTAFFAGKTSMMIISTGSLSFVREKAKFDYDVAFVPRNVRNAVPIGGASLVMFNGLPPEQQKAGWTFVKWLTTPEQLGAWSRFTGYFAPRKSSYELAEMKDFIAKNPDALTAVKQLPYAHPWFATYQTVAVRKALEDEVQAVLSGKKKAEVAVKDAQKKADELMRPYIEQTALKLP